MRQDVVDPHAGHEGGLALEPEARGAGTAQDRRAEVPDLRLAAERGDVFLPDREVPERRHGIAPRGSLMAAGALTLELQDRIRPHRSRYVVLPMRSRRRASLTTSPDLQKRGCTPEVVARSYTGLPAIRIMPAWPIMKDQGEDDRAYSRRA